MKRSAILAVALLAAACEEQVDESPVAQGGEAAGEVLGGSISDAMIPLEQLESEAPLLPRRSPAPDAGDEGEMVDDAGEADAQGEAAEAPPADSAPEAPTR